MKSSLFFSLPLALRLASFSVALPTSSFDSKVVKEEVNELRVRDVSATQLNEFNLIEQYAAAAYCPDNNGSNGTAITCSNGGCALVQAAGATSVIEFQNSLITDVTGFVATDPTNNLIVVAFRGSKSIRNWLANVNFIQTETDLCNDCWAHSGFWESWNEKRDDILAAVKSAADAHPNYQVVATGHSLGAALATFAAAELRNASYEAALYTFGSPRVGNEALAFFIGNQTGGNYRLTHTIDPVPRLPPANIGYTHLQPEYFISSANEVPVETSDITVLQGLDNQDGDDDGGPKTEVSAHKWYFANISSCDPGLFSS